MKKQAASGAVAPPRIRPGAAGRAGRHGGSEIGGSEIGGSPRQIAGYIAGRFPLHTQGVAVLATYLSSWALYSIGATRSVHFARGTAAGAATFLLLFVEMRLADDINDLRHDIPATPTASRSLGRTRAWLMASFATAVIGVVLLNLAWPAALATALSATGLMLVTPLIVKRAVRENRVLLAPCYEGVTAVVLLQAYVSWTDVTGKRVPAAVVAGVVGMFWAAYEFWKFSRKAGQDAYQPYGLGERGLRVVLTCLLGLALVCDLLVGTRLSLSVAFTVYGAAAPVAFACWLNARWPRPVPPAAAGRAGGSAGDRRRPGWSGLLFAATLLAAVLIEAVLAGSR